MEAPKLDIGDDERIQLPTLDELDDNKCAVYSPGAVGKGLAVAAVGLLVAMRVLAMGSMLL